MRRSEIAELIGDGYGDLQSRTIRRHKAQVLATIRMQAGDSVVKQRELATAVLETFSGGQPGETISERTRHHLQEFVCEGVAEVLGVMSDRRDVQGGRFKHDVQQARQVLHSSIVSNVPKGKVAAVARMLNVNRQQLEGSRALYQAFIDGERLVPHDAKAKSCNAYPHQYTECVKKL
jgi:hypothetical protein